jgi:hypothetical protein
MRNPGRLRSGTATAGALLLCVIAGGIVAYGTQRKATAGSVFVPEKGKFNILLDGKSVGHEDYEIAANAGGWTAHGTTSLKPPEGAASTVSGTLTLQPDGVPISYDWTSQAEKSNAARVLFANGVAKMTLQMQGTRPYEQDLSFAAPLIVVLDNNLYHQYAVLARIYDWSKRGTQSFPVLIPQELTPGTISVDWAGAVSAEGKTYEGLKVVTSDLEIVLYLDGNHRLVRMEVPAAKVVVVRE